MKRILPPALLSTAAFLTVGVTAPTTAPASAAAVVTRASITTIADPQPIQSDHCGAGIIFGKDTFTYTSVEAPTGGFNIAGTDVATGRIDWSDGSYSLIGSTDRQAFHANAGTTVFSDAHTDFADNYSADGLLESQGIFYAAEHVTATEGVIVRVDIDYNHTRGTFC
jgi:hypothetical protein